MIPDTEDLTPKIKMESYPSYTYKLHYETDSRVASMTDGLDAIKQAIYKILQTERYQYLIYSWDYGIELQDLYGKPIPYVYAELERRVTEALIQDDRIKSVEDFEFSNDDEDVLMKFVVVTILGDIEIEERVAYVR